MRYFQQIAAGVDVLPLLIAVHRQPELWNQHRARKEYIGSPHTQMDDIWVRFRAWGELTESADYAEPHTPVWYPAYYQLPQIRPILFGLMARVEAVQLGGVLITRIPPGGQIEPHDDRGRWHSEFMNMKVYVPLRSNTKCINRCEEEAVVMGVGEAWTFDNLHTHSVENNGEDDRITLIVSMRCE